MKLLVSQKDEIFDLIDCSDFFSPSQFKFVEIQSTEGIITEINFEDSDYHFRFIGASGFTVNYSPGENSYFEGASQLDWKSGIEHLKKWLKFLKKETTSPNKWNRLLYEITSIHISSERNEVIFSYKNILI